MFYSMNMRTRLQRLFALVFIPLVMLIFFNQKANKHYHVLESGLVIEHSHPYKNSATPDNPFQEHKHSSAELFFFAQLSEIAAFLIVAVLLAKASLDIYKQKKPALQKVYIKSEFFTTQSLRGPPQNF